MSSSHQLTIDDSYFKYDATIPKTIRQTKPFEKDVKYWNHCTINVSAAIKMLKHAIQGVLDGKTQGGMSIEVMGLMIGKPQGNTIIVTDVIQLPIQGMENRIEAADEVQVFIAAIVEILELKREERVLGWYHSHPFELSSYSHCHMSSTDVGTQQAWQFGSPWWTAVVIDPIRSLAQNSFEFGAYRCYPPHFNADDGVAPDGSTFGNISKLKEQWGVVPHRYYQLSIDYWISSHSAKLFNLTTEYTNWVKPLLQDTFRNYNDYLKDLARINTQLSYQHQLFDNQNDQSSHNCVAITSQNAEIFNPTTQSQLSDPTFYEAQFPIHSIVTEAHDHHNNSTAHNMTKYRAISHHSTQCHCNTWLSTKILSIFSCENDSAEMKQALDSLKAGLENRAKEAKKIQKLSTTAGAAGSTTSSLPNSIISQPTTHLQPNKSINSVNSVDSVLFRPRTDPFDTNTSSNNDNQGLLIPPTFESFQSIDDFVADHQPAQSASQMMDDNDT